LKPEHSETIIIEEGQNAKIVAKAFAKKY